VITEVLRDVRYKGAGPARAGGRDHFEAPFTRAPLRTVIDARSTYDLGNITVYTRTIGLTSGHCCARRLPTTQLLVRSQMMRRAPGNKALIGDILFPDGLVMAERNNRRD
jgi:hypothetical protein